MNSIFGTRIGNLKIPVVRRYNELKDQAVTYICLRSTFDRREPTGGSRSANTTLEKHYIEYINCQQYICRIDEEVSSKHVSFSMRARVVNKLTTLA